MAFAASVPSVGFRADAEADAFDGAVARMLTGDEAAFASVYRALQPALLRYLTVMVGRNEAEDVASETWSQAIRDRRRFRGDGAGFRAWLTTIGRHRALDHLRRVGRRPIEHMLDEAADLADPVQSDQAALDAIATRRALAV